MGSNFVLYISSLQLVEGVYKLQQACAGWASVTELWITLTSLEKIPPGHPKTFKRMLDIISLFILAISNNINLFPNFYSVLHENIKKIKLLHTDCPHLKNKHWHK